MARRESRPLLESVFSRIAVNQHGCSALALGSERLESTVAVRIRVAHKHDLAPYIDSVLAQQFVIFGIAAVRVDNRRRDITREGHSGPRGTDLRIFRIGIHVVRLFPQRSAVM